MSSTDQYQQQTYWKNLSKYQDLYDISTRQIEDILHEEKTKICEAIADGKISGLPKNNNFVIENLTIGEIMERYPLLPIEDINKLNENIK